MPDHSGCSGQPTFVVLVPSRNGCFVLAAAATAATAGGGVVVEIPNHNSCFVLVLVLVSGQRRARRFGSR